MRARQRDSVPSGHVGVLVIEDEADIRDLLRYNLTREGFAVTCAATGEEGLRAARAKAPALILLDLMLPGMDGLELCRLLKSDAQTKAAMIVMVTAKGEESDVVAGLELGADDYVVKPFSPRVLIARLRAVLRRHAGKGAEPGDNDMLRVGGLTVDPQRYEVRAGDEVLPLTRTEFQIVHLLARRPGRVFTRTQIVQGVQGNLAAVTDRSVDVHVVSLRKKMGEAGGMIQTVRGVGYRLEEV